MLKLFKKRLNDPTEQQLKKLHIKQVTKRNLFNMIKRIHKENMRKRGSDYCADAMYGLMEDYCVISNHDRYLLVFWDRVEKCLNKYKRGKISSPVDMPVKKLCIISKMFINDQISEC
jgi:hypothetical protein